jgi:hypothetical protein
MDSDAGISRRRSELSSNAADLKVEPTEISLRRGDVGHCEQQLGPGIEMLRCEALLVESGYRDRHVLEVFTLALRGYNDLWRGVETGVTRYRLTEHRNGDDQRRDRAAELT